MALWSRIRMSFRGDHLNREIDEELESHIKRPSRQGRDPVESVARAFGSALRHREGSRRRKPSCGLNRCARMQYSAGVKLGKLKFTSAAAILSLALAIGACMSAFRLIDACCCAHLPVANPNDL